MLSLTIADSIQTPSQSWLWNSSTAFHQRDVVASHCPWCVLPMHATTLDCYHLCFWISHASDRSRAGTILTDFFSACSPLLPHPPKLGSAWLSSSSSAYSWVPRHLCWRDNWDSSCMDSRHRWTALQVLILALIQNTVVAARMECFKFHRHWQDHLLGMCRQAYVTGHWS